jgi:hypothetical protein
MNSRAVCCLSVATTRNQIGVTHGLPVCCGLFCCIINECAYCTLFYESRNLFFLDVFFVQEQLDLCPWLIRSRAFLFMDLMLMFSVWTCLKWVISPCMLISHVVSFLWTDWQGEKDDKIIAVCADDPEYRHYTDIKELPPHRLAEIRRFFEDCILSPSLKLNCSLVADGIKKSAVGTCEWHNSIWYKV